MPAAIMPAQHGRWQAARIAKPQDAFHIPRRDNIAAIFSSFFAFLTCHALKEARGRHLLVITHHHHLPAARNSAERIHGFYLARFINDQQIKGKPGLQPMRGAQELRDRKRAHHENRLGFLHGLGGAQQQFAHRQMAALLFHLSAQNRHPRRAIAHFLHALRMGIGRFYAGQRNARAIGFAEILNQAIRRGTVKSGQFRVLRHGSAEQGFMQREGKHMLRRFGRDAAIRQTFQQRLQPRRRGCSAAPAQPGIKRFRRRSPIAQACGKCGKGGFIRAKRDAHIKLRCLLQFPKGIECRLQRCWFCRLGAIRECRQRRRTMGLAPSEQGSQWRGITRLPLPECSKSCTA